MPKCNLCNRNMSFTQEGVYRAHTVSKNSKEVCKNSGMPAPDWWTEHQVKKSVMKSVMGETYQDYLQTEHWKEISEETKRLAGYRCQLCNSDGELHAHHRTYERKGRELQSDLIALCSKCHKTFHTVPEEERMWFEKLERTYRTYKVLRGTLMSFNPNVFPPEVYSRIERFLGENLPGDE